MEVGNIYNWSWGTAFLRFSKITNFLCSGYVFFHTNRQDLELGEKVYLLKGACLASFYIIIKPLKFLFKTYL